MTPITMAQAPATDTAEELAQYKAALQAILAVCREASAGNLEPRVPPIGVGDLATVRAAFNHLLDETDAFVREAGASLTAASQKRFHRRFMVRGMLGTFRDGARSINTATGAMADASHALTEAHRKRLQLADEFEQAVKSVSEHVAAASTEMRATAADLARTADQTATRSLHAFEGATQASNNVTTIASATEEMSSTVAEIERQASLSNTAAVAAVEEVGKTSRKMTHLDEASRQIGQVVNVITHVANQTRLLALNATIEAARAGDAGKGFAVVASEVKNLATQTAGATEQIIQQVEAIQGATSEAMGGMTSIGEAITRVQDNTGLIVRAVAEQRQASSEISRNTLEAANSTQEVSSSIQSVSRATEETSVAAGQMETAAAELSGLAERLQAEVERFIHAVREG